MKTNPDDPDMPHCTCDGPSPCKHERYRDAQVANEARENMLINLREWLLAMEAKAELDSDPVSIEGFTGDGAAVGGLMLIRTPEAFAAVVRFCEAEGFITPGKGIADGTLSTDGTVKLTTVHRTSVDTVPPAASIDLDPRPNVDIRIRYERDPKRRGPGTVNGMTADRPGWLLLASDGERVLEVCMLVTEYASETVERFVRAYDPSAPGLEGQRVPPSLAKASKALAMRMLRVPS